MCPDGAALDLRHDLLDQRPGVPLVARLRVLRHAVARVDAQDEEVLDGEDLRRELHERGESPFLETEEVRVRDAGVRLGHEQELVGTDGSVRSSMRPRPDG